MVLDLAVIPTMSSEATLERLRQIASGFRGLGVIVECGTYLGATLKCLSDSIAGTPATFHAFEKFQPNEYEVQRARRFGVDISGVGDSRDWINSNVRFSPNHEIKLHRTNLKFVEWSGEPIEIFVLDAAKQNPAFQHVIDTFSGSWIEQVTKVCLLDAYYREHDASRDCQRQWLATNYPDHDRLESGAYFIA